jgi:hypothetical protein
MSGRKDMFGFNRPRAAVGKFMLRLMIVPLVVLAVLAFGDSGASAQVTCFGKGPVLTCFNPSGGPAYQVNCFGNPDHLTCLSQQGSFAASTANAGAGRLNAPSLESTPSAEGLLSPQNQMVRPCLVPLTCLSGTADSASALSGTLPTPRPTPGTASPLSPSLTPP